MSLVKQSVNLFRRNKKLGNSIDIYRFKVHFDEKIISRVSGWADTPAVKTSIPDFYERMKSRLRSPQQGADTLIWLCASEIVREEPSGGFYQDRSTVSKHLPLAWTKSSVKEEEEFLKKLEEIASNFRS